MNNRIFGCRVAEYAEMGTKYGTQVTSIHGNEYCYQDPCGDYILSRASVSHAFLAKNTYISLTYICTAGR